MSRNILNRLLVFSFLVSNIVYGSSYTPKFIKNLENGEGQTIITYGTSLTKLGAWSSQLKSLLKQQSYSGKINFFNTSQGGSNSDWGKTNFDTRVLNYNPDTVFIEFAMNDSVRHRKITVQDSKINLEEMIDRLLELNSKCEIILMTMNPAIEHHGLIRPNLELYYQMYRDVAKERDLLLIDNYVNWKQVLDKNPNLFLEYVPDGIHPVRSGCLNVTIPEIQKVLGLNGDPNLSKDIPCWKYLFNNIDKSINKDKEVTFQEYELYWKTKFLDIDRSNDGILQLNEYKSKGVFNYLDGDNDNLISFKEYLNFYFNYFKTGDINKDNILDYLELKNI